MDFGLLWKMWYFSAFSVPYVARGGQRAGGKTGGRQPGESGPLRLMTVKTWTGVVLIQFHGRNVENPV